jgi:hypothetical protein
MTNENYNGWSNYQTWNVALWIQNEFSFYAVALACGSYREFLYSIAEDSVGLATPDGVSWFDPVLNFAELDAMIEEF